MKYHWHWQNLSDAPGHERHGFWHGRAWLHFGEKRRRALHGEWVHGRLGFALSVRFDCSDNEVMFHIALPGLSYYLGLEGISQRFFDLLPMKYKREDHGGYERAIGVRFDDGALWFDVWSDPMDWRSSDPKWMQFSLHLDDLIFGKTKYETRVIEERGVTVPMPEGSYGATAKREVSTWTRPRWPWRPFSKRRDVVTIDIPGGIGIPGKGENDWDIDDDAVYAQSSAATTIEQAIGNVVASILSTRRRRGWSGARLKAVP